MTISMRSRGRICVLFALALFGTAAVAPAQSAATPDGTGIKLGILPFVDATASGNRTAGTDVARTMLSEVVHSTSLQPRLIVADGSVRDAELDPEQAVALGRSQHVDLVFMGTVLEARSEESSKSGWLPSIKGQSGNVNVRRVKATVTLQGELYDVTSGRRLFSVRATGTDSHNVLGGTAYTTFGAWGNDSYRSFLESPMGKALQTAIADMTKKIAAARPQPYSPILQTPASNAR